MSVVFRLKVIKHSKNNVSLLTNNLTYSFPVMFISVYSGSPLRNAGQQIPLEQTPLLIVWHFKQYLGQ